MTATQDAPIKPIIVLGCAQLGLPYGRANVTGQPSATTAAAILDAAWDCGVRWFDTARAYGSSEEHIGEFVRRRAGAFVVTKVSALVAPDNERLTPADIRARTSASVRTSLELLAPAVPTVLVHRAAHRTVAGGAVWDVLREFHARGAIGGVGVSATSPDELVAALEDASVSLVQFPTNVLDHRFRSPIVRNALARRPEVTIHIRSLFLQGLLLTTSSRWPTIPGVHPERILEAIATAARRAHTSVAQLCVAAIRETMPVHGVVLGAETVEQVRANADLLAGPAVPSNVLAELAASIPELPETILDPARWPPLQ